MTADLPGPDEVGLTQEWSLPTDSGEVRVLVVRAKLLGCSSSQSLRHTHPGPYVDRTPRRGETRGDRCSACSWFEPRILREEAGERRYLMHFTGMTKVPGETIRYRHEFVRTAPEVLEVLITRRRTPGPDGVRETFLTVPAARVLAQASAYDDEIRGVYENRAVL